MMDFCDILKCCLPPDNTMWTWGHIHNLIDSMGEWKVGQDYRRLPLCWSCTLYIFAENDYTTLCPRCNPSEGVAEADESPSEVDSEADDSPSEVDPEADEKIVMRLS
jgi:hypothetical protein